MTTPQVASSQDPESKVLSAWTELSRVATEVGHPDLLQPFSKSRERLELGLFRLVVMGEIKKGKSSFVNALLGEPELLPIGSDIATSTVYKVLYGPEKKYKVFFQPELDTGRHQPPLHITPEEVASYGTEAGNPKNHKGVEFIGVELPNPLLKEGLVLVDTPGVGGLYKAHRQITWEYAPSADAVFFVLDSVEAVISQDEVQFLKELIGKVTRRVYFIQTKTDVAGVEQWRSWRDRNLEVLSDALRLPSERLFYFPVSSKLKIIADRRASPKHLSDSGFLPIINFLQHNLMRETRRHLARDLASQLLVGCKTLRNDVSERQHIVKAGQQSDLDQVRKEYEIARKEFDEWQRTQYGQELKTFKYGLADLKQKARLRIQEDLDPTGLMVTSILDSLKQTEFNPLELVSRAGEYQQDCLAQASEDIGSIYKDFNTEFERLLADTCHRLAKGFQSKVGQSSMQPTPKLNEIPIRQTLDVQFNSFESVRNAMYGGMAGGMMANIGIFLAGSLFPPAAAVSGVALLLASAFGVYKAHESAQIRKREEVVTKLSSILQDGMRKAQRQALAQFDAMTTNLERHSEEQIQAASETRRHELEDRLQQVDKSRGLTREQYQTQAQQISTWTAILTRIETDLNSMRVAIQPSQVNAT